VTSGEKRKIGGQLGFKGLVKSDTEGTLTRKFEQDECADVNQSNLLRVSASLVHEIAEGSNQLINIAFGENVIHEKWIFFQHLPKQNQKFLEALEPWRRARQKA